MQREHLPRSRQTPTELDGREGVSGSALVGARRVHHMVLLARVSDLVLRCFVKSHGKENERP